ncbi:DNA-dependent metalloprotease SPRTN [Bombina bombina]|uniref:DNA-dependent metalloprotease SPRTN n=1 Tax=Bombina bombina TaxID=8345 RepID=UPI00235AD0E0|nr:DNA-dependent metalloprotease SPRTN [Bombina bombina]
MDGDFLLALRLQEQYDQEEAQTQRKYQDVNPSSPREVLHKPVMAVTGTARSKEMSVVDPSWEMIDPNPDIRALFLQFNDMFFWSKLSGVEVKWSPRMTLCAGVCSYEGRGGLCSVRLSEPLLKLRPRKDLVETLLHEMIHALLFVTHNNKDHDSHGPEFCKHMKRINDMTGSKISVYHSFHDEVDEYRKHWWRCDGPCQNRKPYFGYVKRAMNRAPSSLDPWWSEHQRTCGGKYIKIKEPENYSQKGKGKDNATKPQASTETNKKTSMASKEPDVKTSKSHGVDIRTVIPFSGVGYKLNDTTKTVSATQVKTVIPSAASKPSLPTTSSTNAVPNNKVFIPNTTNINNPATSKKPHVPKISVGNAKVFINVNGSPVRLPVSGNKATTGHNPCNGKREFPSNLIQKKISFETPHSSKTAPSFTSQGSSSGNDYTQPSKRPRVDSKAFENFFVKAPKSTSKESESLPNIFNHIASTSSNSMSQSVKVNCPICRTEVYESKINDHLDSCLAAC